MREMKKDLLELQNQIDEINLKLLQLLNYRSELVGKIRQIKDVTNLEYFDPEREHQMLSMIMKGNKGPLPNELLKEIFVTIFQSTLKYMGISKEKELLITSPNNGFQNLQQMFDLSTNEPIIIAGPCAVENYEYLEEIASLLSKNNIKFLRGGTYKPRTSPYEFQGLREEGLKILSDVGRRHGLITITEVVDTRDVDIISEYIDILQIGARNMSNFELLKEVGRIDKPVLLKRGMSATIQEMMFAAEYIALQGNRKIIFCERGIRTYETKTRNTLDISGIPIIKKETNIPIIVDLSHSLGRKDIINPIAKAVLASGADGIMVEVHPYPELALSDSKQQLRPEEFIDLIENLK